MELTLLLDLDDTLLDTNMDVFLPAYFQGLAKHVDGIVASKIFLPALRSATQLMLANQDPSTTLQDVFDNDFYPAIGVAKSALAVAIEDFYDHVFPTLGSLTRPHEGAADFVAWGTARGYRMAIATDPLFPQKATLQRIRWAGIDPERFELVSSYESFHFSKSHPTFFGEIMGRLGWPDGAVLMVGNDLQRDILPAQKLGLASFQIETARSDPSRTVGQPAGNFSELQFLLEETAGAQFEASYRSTESILAILRSTPAVLQSLLAGLHNPELTYEPTPEEWGLIEVLCHLRDTEREIHHLQVEILLKDPNPFVPRPDAPVWAKERNYINEDGPAALREFTTARLETLEQLRGVDETIWLRKARHAIFGPSNFREVVGFMADHDRLHIQQVWNILTALSSSNRIGRSQKGFYMAGS